MIPFINDNQSLQRYCLQASSQKVLMLDTEFIRQSTLVPKLGLIQLYDGEQLALVDPLTISDWLPFQQLLANPNVVKVMHACMEDIEALATIGVELIRPLMDTQMAALVLGMGASVGFAALVERFTGEQLDKGESRTNWLARPLRDAQLQYAANDVLYLLPVYQHLMHQLSPERVELLQLESEQLMLRRSMQWPDHLRFIDIKNSWQLSPRALAVLQRLTEWRIQYARSKDLALTFIFKDAQLFELAKRSPGTMSQLLAIRDLPERELRRHGSHILALIEQAVDGEPSEWPQPFYDAEHFPGYREAMSHIRQAVQRAAQSEGVPAELLATKRQQTEFLNWCWRVTPEVRAELPEPELLRGWRRDLLQRYLPWPERFGISKPTSV